MPVPAITNRGQAMTSAPVANQMTQQMRDTKKKPPSAWSRSLRHLARARSWSSVSDISPACGRTAGTAVVGTSPSTSPVSSPRVLAADTAVVRVSNSSRSSRPSAYASARTWWTTLRSWSEARSGAYSGRRGSRVKDDQICPGSVIRRSQSRFAS